MAKRANYIELAAQGMQILFSQEVYLKAQFSQSETNSKEFSNSSKELPDSLLEYLNSIEILNRQSLPLRSNFNRKVQEYFNTK